MIVRLLNDGQSSNSEGGLDSPICFCWCMLLVYKTEVGSDVN